MSEPVSPNQPQHILSAWTALEVLSPQTFKKPPDLAGGDARLIVQLGKGLPWENGGEKDRPNTRLYYQVVIGSIPMDKAMSRLLEIYSDKREDRTPAKGEAILAALVLDRKGKLAGETPVALSSFAWGLPKALKGELAALSEWTKTEQELLKKLDKLIRITDEGGEEQPVDQVMLSRIYDFQVKALGLSADLVSPERFAIRVYDWSKNPEPPEPLLLNSFFLNDLAQASGLFKTEKAPKNLKRFIGADPPINRKDLNSSLYELEKLVSPVFIPPGRWPSRGTSSLVLLQQAAVNIALSELKEGGIAAVNGPPGTGKTTLLRDLVAGIVCERAEAMLAFDDPEKAFIQSGQKVAAGSAWLHLYELDKRLKGYEILITSSNNKAVENVSAELPGITAIGDVPQLRYFSLLSDQLLERESWGLIAAVLGNATNRTKFRKTFWWDEDLGMNAYLAEAAGTPQFVNVIDPDTHQITGKRKPKLIEAERPPDNHISALQQWQAAKQHFLNALNESRAELKKLAELKALVELLPSLTAQISSAGTEVIRLQQKAEAIELETEKLNLDKADLNIQLEILQKRISSHNLDKPNWFKRFLNIDPAPVWKQMHQELMREARQLEKAITQLDIDLLNQQTEAGKIEAALKKANVNIKALNDRRRELEQKIEAARQTLKRNLIDEGFFSASHQDRHQISPWHDQSLRGSRDKVFVAAMQLHRAFIHAAAKPLRHNLGVLMMVFNGKQLVDKAKEALLPDLWSSLFMVVPAVSSTFASIERMLGKLPAESIGWLLVDEAGQALPQAAVGAIMRTRRAVIVGDPVQIEPIVPLPDSLTQAICRYFSIDPDRFNAPEASVQTLADAACTYFAEFEGKSGSRTVGIPLLVHRRCADPMFSIANAIAYSNLMVHAKGMGTSPIRDCLGNSHWINIQGQGIEKWCPEEGQAVLQLLQKLKAKAITPDLYIVTPFVTVAENLRRMLLQTGILNNYVADPVAWVYERIGTVHTVQGREAEAVIFVLGAPLPTQNGARNWAGGQPNLLNVAITRAKEVLYVVGNRELWKSAGLFGTLAASISYSI